MDMMSVLMIRVALMSVFLIAVSMRPVSMRPVTNHLVSLILEEKVARCQLLAVSNRNHSAQNNKNGQDARRSPVH